MAEEHNIIIEHLRALRNDNAELKKGLDGGLRSVKEELVGIRQHMGGFLTHEGVQDEEIATLRARVERLESRLNISE